MKMGSSFKSSIFNEQVHAGLAGWRDKVKKKKTQQATGSTQGGSAEAPAGSGGLLQLARKAAASEPAEPAAGSDGPK